jgi:hypothetical protein
MSRGNLLLGFNFFVALPADGYGGVEGNGIRSSPSSMDPCVWPQMQNIPITNPEN